MDKVNIKLSPIRTDLHASQVEVLEFEGARSYDQTVAAWQCLSRLIQTSGKRISKFPSKPLPDTSGVKKTLITGAMTMAGCDPASKSAFWTALAAVFLFLSGYYLWKARKATLAVKNSFETLEATVLPLPHVIALEGVSTERWRNYVDTALVRFASGGSIEKARKYTAMHSVDFDAFREGGLEVKKDGTLLTGGDIFSMLIDREGFNVAGLYAGWESSARELKDVELDAELDEVGAGHDMGSRMASRGAFLWELEAVSRKEKRFGFTDLLEYITRDRSYFSMLDVIAIPTFLAVYYDKKGEHKLAKRVRKKLLPDGNQAAHLLREGNSSALIKNDGNPVEAKVIEALLMLQSARTHLWWVYPTDERLQHPREGGSKALRKIIDKRMELLTLVFNHLNCAREVLDNPSVIGDELHRSEPLQAVRSSVNVLWDEAAQTWNRDCPFIDDINSKGSSGPRVADTRARPLPVSRWRPIHRFTPISPLRPRTV